MTDFNDRLASLRDHATWLGDKGLMREIADAELSHSAAVTRVKEAEANVERQQKLITDAKAKLVEMQAALAEAKDVAWHNDRAFASLEGRIGNAHTDEVLRRFAAKDQATKAKVRAALAGQDF